MKRTIFTLTVLLAATATLFAQEPTLKGLLVSIEKYQMRPLNFAENDIMYLSTLLLTRYNGIAQACIDTPKDERSGNAPMRDVMNMIDGWCRSLTDDDVALLYLSGHGVKDVNGKLYLAMINFDGKNFTTAAIPMEWIREQFGSAKGKHKLLLIDTCFSGTAKSLDFDQASAAESGAVFAGLKDVIVIASSSENEESWLWRNARHSLFTYWVIEAFKGHADSNNDRILTCDEIVKFIQTNVTQVARNVLSQQQHPVVHNAEAGKGFQLQLRALSTDRLISDIAEQIDRRMRTQKYKSLAIPEFTDENGRFNPKYGGLPRDFSEKLRKRLGVTCEANGGGYKILSENKTQALMQSINATPSDLGDEKTRNIKVDGMEVSALIDGRVTLFDNGSAALRAVLLDTAEESEVGNFGGLAMLTAEQIAMTGGSSVIPTALSPRPQPIPEGYVNMPGLGSVDAQLLQEANEVLNMRNKPLPSNPFTVRFEVRPINQPNAAYVKRDFVKEAVGNERYLPLSKGEQYRIVIKCETEHEVFVRVLVDGLNTLSQLETVTSKDFMRVNKQGEFVVMPRASLTDARAWVIQPNVEYVIEGFYDANGPNGKGDTLQRFHVVDADESAAVRKNYTEQLGLITIGFFKPDNPQGQRALRLGTAAGEIESIGPLVEYTGDKVPGQMMGWYNIRYLTPEALEQLP